MGDFDIKGAILGCNCLDRNRILSWCCRGIRFDRLGVTRICETKERNEGEAAHDIECLSHHDVLMYRCVVPLCSHFAYFV